MSILFALFFLVVLQFVGGERGEVYRVWTCLTGLVGHV